MSAIERQCETEPEGDRPQSDEPSHEPAPRAFLLDEGVFVELQVGKVFHVGLTFALACVQGNTEAWRALLRRRERSRTAQPRESVLINIRWQGIVVSWHR